MNSTGLKAARPTLFRWILVALAIGTIFSGVYEVLPIIDADRLSGAWWQIIIHVILLTTFFKIFFCLTFSITICSLGWAIAALAAIYMSEPLLLMEHIVALTFSVGMILIVIGLYKNRKNLTDLATDSLFLLGTGMVTNSCSLILGISLGQSRNNKESTRLATSQKSEVAQLVAQRDLALEKIQKLHQFIRGIWNAPTIPPELNP
jgi:hypothetical protein